MVSPVTPDLSVTIAGIRMKNPVMVASGTFGYGPEYARLIDINQLGAIAVKGIHKDPIVGNKPPRVHEVRSGLINAIGLQGPGAKGFIEHYLPFLRQHDVPVIVNIWGKSLDEYGQVAEMFEGVPGVHGLEINISCPNIKEGGIEFSANPASAATVVKEVRSRTKLPLFTKLAPNVPRIADYARAVEAEGTDAISLTNTIPAMAIDVERRTPCLSNVVGGLSGPAIRPVAVKLVWDAARAVKIPIVGMGGIETANDALEFLIAGAQAVAVGTATFTDPTAPLKVIAGLRDYLVRHGFASLREVVGSLKLP